jgi:SAM-dependent methyltransferase
MPHLQKLLWPVGLVTAWILGVLMIGVSQDLWILPLLPSFLLALSQRRRWRQLTAVCGMVMIQLLHAWEMRPDPLWALVAFALLVLVYPVRAWRDAPVFPTGRRSLDPLIWGPWSNAQKGLDLGCGLGHGLIALRGIAPQAQWTGVEMSFVLAFLCQLRCSWARILRKDMWSLDWSEFDFVYSFQRPETMSRLWTKAQRELQPASWVISFQFAIPDQVPDWSAQNRDGQWLFAYKIPPAEVCSWSQC